MPKLSEVIKTAASESWAILADQEYLRKFQAAMERFCKKELETPKTNGIIRIGVVELSCKKLLENSDKAPSK